MESSSTAVAASRTIAEIMLRFSGIAGASPNETDRLDTDC